MGHRGLVWGGVAVAVAGVLVGGAIALAADAVQTRTIEGFARAPVGCTTTLDFERADTFTFFVETTGELDVAEGGCGDDNATYERGDDDPPRVELTFVDDDGGEVPLADSDRYSYDTDRFVGSAIAEATIESAGTYRLIVTSEENDFAIAIGGDPEATSGLVLVLGGLVLLLGLVAGALMVGLGLRRRPEPPAPMPVAPPAAVPVGAWAPPSWAPPPPAPFAPTTPPPPPPIPPPD